jgi:hypothetical protein
MGKPVLPYGSNGRSTEIIVKQIADKIRNFM